jgi:hypothetical protein
MSIAPQDLDQLLNMARAKLSGASNAMLKAELYDVLTEFFNDSNTWWETLLVNALPTVVDYDMVASEGTIKRLAGVTDVNGSPWAAAMPVMGSLHLDHAPATAMTLYAVIIKTTSLPTDRHMIPVAPDWVLPQWHVEVLDGLLGKMYGQKDRNYSDGKLADYHLRRFRKGIAAARTAVLRANSMGTQAWRFPQTFSSRTQQGGVPSLSGNTRSF